jgi:hypothetical protein
VLSAALALAIGGCGENPDPDEQALAAAVIDPKTVLDITVEAACSSRSRPSSTSGTSAWNERRVVSRVS